MIKIASAAPRPYGNGNTNCKPMLTANEANKNIKYIKNSQQANNYQKNHPIYFGVFFL